MAPVFVIPLIAGAVGGAFAAVVARQYSSRRKPYQAVWAVALAMFAAAALFETAGQAFGWSDATYKGYYLFGGVLNVGWLGLGSLLLLIPTRAGRIATIAMVVVSIVGLLSVLVAHTNPELLRAQVPARGAIDVPAVLPIVTNLGGSLLLIGGAGWSAWKAARSGAPRNRVVGLAVLAAGAFIVAAGHGYAQTKGVYAAQPLSEALGIVSMFVGYLVVESRLPVLARERAA
jgi:small-conductance mechanosensitive channel